MNKLAKILEITKRQAMYVLSIKHRKGMQAQTLVINKQTTHLHGFCGIYYKHVIFEKKY